MRITGKLIVFILSTTFVIFAAVIAFIGINYQNMAREKAIQLADVYAKEAATQAESNLNLDLGVIRGMSNAFARFPEIKSSEQTSFYEPILREVLLKNSAFLATWVSWDLEIVDKSWTKP